MGFQVRCILTRWFQIWPPKYKFRKKKPRPAPLKFECFLVLFLANFDHKATYRRQTMNILLRHIFVVLAFGSMLKTFHLWKFKISKNIFGNIFGFVKNILKIKKKMGYISPLELSIRLLNFQEPFSDPKSVKIHPRKIAVEILGF